MKLSVLAVCLSLASQAGAQECIPRPAALQVLNQGGFQRVGAGMNNGSPVEIWANPLNGQFLVVSIQRGAACIIVAGEQFQQDYWGVGT